MKNVVKRDGRVVRFDSLRIVNAIMSAMYETDVGGDVRLATAIANDIEQIDKDMNVEEIQDIIEEKLMESNRKDAAKKFIIYRNERTKSRRRNSKFMRNVAEKIMATNIENQNANVDERSFGGRFGAVASEVLKDYALNELLSDMARSNHLNNEIYIHDLDHYALGDHNCLSIPFDDLLANGFDTRQTDVRPAQSISTAFQLVAVIFQLQSLQQFGGVSATHLDHTMVPYVRKSFFKHYVDGMKYVVSMNDAVLNKETDILKSLDPTNISILDTGAYAYVSAYEYAMDMTEREARQAIEGMYHNLK